MPAAFVALFGIVVIDLFPSSTGTGS